VKYLIASIRQFASASRTPGLNKHRIKTLIVEVYTNLEWILDLKQYYSCSRTNPNPQSKVLIPNCEISGFCTYRLYLMSVLKLPSSSKRLTSNACSKWHIMRKIYWYDVWKKNFYYYSPTTPCCPMTKLRQNLVDSLD
jgi:hypothetical protein